MAYRETVPASRPCERVEPAVEAGDQQLAVGDGRRGEDAALDAAAAAPELAAGRGVEGVDGRFDRADQVDDAVGDGRRDARVVRACDRPADGPLPSQAQRAACPDP